MKKIAIYLTAVCAVVGLFSCQKELDFPGTNTLDDNIYLEKIVYLDTTFASGSDTNSVLILSYDSQKRLSNAIQTFYFPGTHNVEVVSTEKRVYTGTDSFPAKRIFRETLSTGEDFLDTSFLTYNSNKNIIRDSTVGFEGPSLLYERNINFTVTGSSKYRVAVTHYDVITPFVQYDTIRTFRGYTGHNLTSAIDSLYSGGIPVFDETRMSITYDNKNNPIGKITLPYLVYPYTNEFGLMGGIGDAQYASENNVKNTQYNFIIAGGSSSATESFEYTYDVKGYPVIVRQRSNGVMQEMKSLLFYKTL